MKRLGLLGGMSWESSIECYRLINEEVRDRLGGLRSPDCLLRSVDFAPVEELLTEIDLLVGPDDAAVPAFDTTRLHARKAVELVLGTTPTAASASWGGPKR